MTGLENIIKQIEDEANQTKTKIIDEANAKAADIVAEANAKAADIIREYEDKASRDTESMLTRAKSANTLEVKKNILLKKQDLIKSAVSKAEQSLCELEDSEYFDTILKLVKKYAPKKSGSMKFNKKDLARLPKNFEASVNKALDADAETLVISDEPVNINGGFILAYGGIEENCSFAALFENAADDLADKAHTLLFE